MVAGLLTGAALAFPTAAVAEAPKKPQFGYFLTKTKLVMQVRQTLVACPDAADDAPLPEIETEWDIEAKPVADTSAFVTVDASHGFLAKRSTALKLRPDGTLVAFDSETSGQGAAVLNAVLKVGSSIFLPGVGIPAAAGLTESVAWAFKVKKPVSPPPNFVECKPDVLKTFESISAWGKQISALEDKVLAGLATAAEIQLLERRKKQRGNARDALVLTSEPIVVELDPTTGAVDTTKDVEKLAHDEWFQHANAFLNAFDQTKVVGYRGFQISVKSPESPFPGDGTELSATRKPSPRLVYRRPVFALVSATPCDTAVDEKCATSSAPEYAKATISDKIAVPQFSGLYSLSTGRGGLFGTRQASAEFDAYGAPIEISYGSDSGAGDIASSITAAGDASETLRDSELTALERQIKLEEARQKLRDLRTPPVAD